MARLVSILCLAYYILKDILIISLFFLSTIFFLLFDCIMNCYYYYTFIVEIVASSSNYYECGCGKCILASLSTGNHSSAVYGSGSTLAYLSYLKEGRRTCFCH